MRSLIVTLALLLVTISASATNPQPAAAQPPAPVPGLLSDQGYLRKLSFQLRGMQPTQDEYKALAAASDHSSFLNDKVTEYLASPEYQDRMVYRLLERLELRTPGLGLTAYKATGSTYGVDHASEDSLTHLIRTMAASNLTWDTLLTGKSYMLYPHSQGLTNASEVTDFAFFRYVVPNLPVEDLASIFQGKLTTASIPANFADDDLRVAGILTTPRFLNRYNTTNINRNRRRAAAVFRTFLCDPMVPVIPPPLDRKGEALGDSFSDVDHANVTEAQIEEVMKLAPKDRHGADQKCAACHYKLDPMGKTFQNIGQVLNPQPAPGMLIYNRIMDQSVKIPVKGIGELGAAIVKQPEYVNCQIDWFWQQFVGNDVLMDFNRRAQLTAAFEANGRRTNDFVRTLVTSPEFRQRPAAVEHVQYAQVQPLLKRCDSCHDDEQFVGRLSEGHISTYDLLDVRDRLNRPESDKHKMPRNWPTWDPKELALVKRWIDEGAVDDQGRIQLTTKDLGGT